MDKLTATRKRMISLKLDPVLFNMLQVLRKDEDRTQTWLIEHALRQTYLEPALAQLEADKREAQPA